MNLNLEDKVVIVTGGAAGIGRATVEAFTSEGAKVVVWDVPEVDVTKPEAVKAATEQVIAEHGRIDVLVNNAGRVADGRRHIRRRRQREPQRRVPLHPRGRAAHD
jgi:3-oxoacyl-[acyl-carrier protein] reductase